ncbi:molybdenum-binding protein [Halobacteriales archaeon QS_4_62_28]|nr:MAG: molybdenum-binding protein [Halobacteriales archaeon QS_4_62_28]
MDASVDAQLRAESVSFTARDGELLRAIGEHGSVSGAAATLGRSRARALARVDTLESAFGPLVERHRGGASGGGSELTPAARSLLTRFERLRTALAGTANVEEWVLPGTVTERTGELGVVETEAGPIRALLARRDSDALSEVGATVQVSVRSDSVTLHSPTDAPATDGTSARNQFEGTVSGIESGAAITQVRVDVGSETTAVALLTRESLDTLALDEGAAVIVSFKATATRAIPVTA